MKHSVKVIFMTTKKDTTILKFHVRNWQKLIFKTFLCLLALYVFRNADFMKIVATFFVCFRNFILGNSSFMAVVL